MSPETPVTPMVSFNTMRQVRKLHEPTLTWLDSVVNPEPGVDEPQVRDVDPDSAEAIVSRQVSCMTCAGYPEWPCETAKLIYSTAEIESGRMGEEVPA